MYCRVLSAEQTKNLPADAGESLSRVLRRQGYDVDRVFVDAGESAKTADRPAFTEMLAYSAARRAGRMRIVLRLRGCSPPSVLFGGPTRTRTWNEPVMSRRL